jgi:hypothetical protein
MMLLVHVTRHLLPGSAQLNSAQLSSARLSMTQEVLCSATWVCPPPQSRLGGLQMPHHHTYPEDAFINLHKHH